MIKKTVISAILAISTGTIAFSQNFIVQVKPIDNDNWGYVNKNGEFIFEAKFINCSAFSSEGLAPVYNRLNKSYYFIDLNGKVLPVEIREYRLYTTYTDIPEGFYDGLARVFARNKWGYLNSSGKVAIPIKFHKASRFSSGYAVAWLKGKIIILDKQYGEHPIDDENIIDVKYFTEDLAPFQSKNNKLGFIDTRGNIIIPAQFLSVGYFSAGLAWAKTDNGKIGYINKKGEWAIKPQFDVANNFDQQSGVARIGINQTMGFVNSRGDIEYMHDATDFGDFSEGLCWGRKDDMVGFFNNKGEWVIHPQFQKVRDFKNGFAAVRISGKWGIIDKEGNWIIQPSFGDMHDMEFVK